jgi:DNA-binding CsgD family transcriptional regulator
VLLTRVLQVLTQHEAVDPSHQRGEPAARVSGLHGLLRAASGQVPVALTVLEYALVDHQLLAMPFDEARTRLLFGSVLRRAGHRSDARRELEAALAVFVRLGTPRQVEQTRAELASVSGRRMSGSELTVVEERIAALVGAGQTNREVAVTLSMSVRPVESHLGRIYRKLGLRSRTELARRLPA